MVKHIHKEDLLQLDNTFDQAMLINYIDYEVSISI